jgi:hypothetical protein
LVLKRAKSWSCRNIRFWFKVDVTFCFYMPASDPKQTQAMSAFTVAVGSKDDIAVKGLNFRF